MNEKFINLETFMLAREKNFPSMIQKENFITGRTGVNRVTQTELQIWLLIEYKIYVWVTPLDSWNEWAYNILTEDPNNPFFSPVKECEGFKTLESAMEAGLIKALNLIK